MKTKPTMDHQKVIDIPGELNLTEEYFNDFLIKSKEHMMKVSLQNKTYINTSGIILDDQTPHPAVNCSEYCSDSHMRQIFDEYKNYHGYVALVVSISFPNGTDIYVVASFYAPRGNLNEVK